MSEHTTPPTPLPYASPPAAPRRGVAFWTGWVLSGLLGAAFIMGGVTDLMKLPKAVEGLTRAGFAEEIMLPIGAVTVVSVLLFLTPRVAMFGAILLTAYLGGAVAVHVHLREYGMMFAPVVFAVVMWVALVLRDRRIRTAVFG